MYQRRFDHLLEVVEGVPRVRPGQEAHVAALQAFADARVEKLSRLAAM
jgi:hypothetical protein